MEPSRRVLTLLVACFVAATAAGCAPPPPRSAATEKSADVTVSGPVASVALTQLLASAYKSPTARFDFIPGLHSSGALQGVVGGDLDVGLLAREPSEQEAGLPVDYYRLSDDGLAIIVSPDVRIQGLSARQVRAIYAGEYTDWSQVGGAEMPITVLDRAEDESAKIYVRRHVLGSTTVSPRAVEMPTDEEMVDAVAQTPGAVGYASLGYVQSRRAGVRVLELDGVKPSVAEIVAGRYKVVRPLGLVVAKDATPEARAFAEWASGPDARKVMEAGGYAPPRKP